MVKPATEDIDRFIDKLTPKEALEIVGVDSATRLSIREKLGALTTEKFEHYEKHFS